MNRLVTLLFFINILATSSFNLANAEQPMQDCEQIAQISLEKLVEIVDKNKFSDLESVLGTIQSSCGESEFTQRLRILRAIIEKSPTDALITDYIDKKYDEILVMRWDYSVEAKHQEIYNENKAAFNYVPLNHAIDSLIKLKSVALLNSNAYSLTENETRITLLFSDNIDEYYRSAQVEETPKIPVEKKTAPKGVKDRGAFVIYAGVEFPITGSDPLFKTNPAFALMYSSKLSNQFIYDLGVKIRVNSNDRSFDYLLYDEIQTVNSGVSLSFGGNLGYKIYDNNKFIIAPKVGLYYEATSTGLTEVTSDYYDDYYDDYYYDDYDQPANSVQFHNVNSMRLNAGLTVMRHLAKKKYLGIEAAYHYISYDWEKNLLTEIQSNYASLQMFFRF